MSPKKSLRFQMIVPEYLSGERLDRALTTLDFISSRSRGAELIEKGHVRIGERALRASHRVRTGEVIDIQVPEAEPSELMPLAAPLDVLFEDSDLIVINKPSGLVVHPAAGHAHDTLVNILLHRCGDFSGLSMGFSELRPGIVHRLDRDTSGILVVAKNDFAHHALAKQFKDRTVRRLYWALIHGKPQPPVQMVRSALARHPTDRKRFASSKTGVGKHAVTHFRVLGSGASDVSWIECRLETGRTHQIRVHLSEQGHPILGDPIYGRKNQKAFEKGLRLCLHAFELGFIHPRTGKEMLFNIGWPRELQEVFQDLGFKNV